MQRGGLGTVFAQMHGAQPAVVSQRMIHAPMGGRGGDNGRLIPARYPVEQRHGALVRDQLRDASTIHGSHRGPWRRINNCASRKLLATPNTTVMPMERKTGSVELPRTANTTQAAVAQIVTACSARRWAAASVLARSRNSP